MPIFHRPQSKPPTNQCDNDSLSATFILNILICAKLLKAWTLSLIPINEINLWKALPLPSPLKKQVIKRIWNSWIVTVKLLSINLNLSKEEKFLVYFMNNQLYEVPLDKENKILTICGLYYVKSVSLHLPSTSLAYSSNMNLSVKSPCIVLIWLKI